MGELGPQDAENIDRNMWAPEDTEGQEQDEVCTAFSVELFLLCF